MEKSKTRIPLLLTTIALVVLAFAGCKKTTNSSAVSTVTPSPSPSPSSSTLEHQSASGGGATQFSSEYTDLKKCGSGMTKKEEKEAEEQGSDIPTRCKGPGGYDIYIYYSACASVFSIEKGQESIPLTMQPVDWQQKTVEWRQVDGKPFAVIMRVWEYSGDDPCATGRKIIGEFLMVKGLKGYEHINEKVDVKTTPDANVKARELADKGYR